MSDALPPEPLISPAQVKIRETLIRDKLRAAGLRHPLLCDAMFKRGVLVASHWQSLHRFRLDVIALPTKGRKDHRGPLPPDARARKPTGFSMSSVPIERALGCRKLMDDAAYECALVLVGEAQGEVTDEEARVAGWQVNEIYAGNAGTQRWKDWG